MANFNKIKDTTPIHDFPEIYNANIEELVREIQNLRILIASKDKRIADLESKYDTYARNLKVYLDNILESKFNEFDTRLERCENSNDALDARLRNLENNQ